MNSDRRQIMAILFFTVLFDQAGILLIAPIMPSLLAELTGLTIEQNAVLSGWLLSAYGITQFCFAPVIGSVSDHYGRRSVLLVSTLVFIIDYLIMALAGHYLILFIGRIIAGIAGATVVTAMAATADISTDRNRAQNYALIYGAMGTGLILGPLLAAVGVPYGIRVPFYSAAGIALINFLLVLVYFKETLPAAKRRPFKFTNPLSSLIKLSRNKGMKELFSAHFLVLVATQSFAVLWAFFSKNRFGWSDNLIAYYMVVVGFFIIATQALLVPKLYPHLGNKNISFLGMGLFVASFLVIAAAANPYWVIAGGILFALSSVANPAFSSIYALQVQESEQGELQGVVASLISLSAIIGPFTVSYLFRFGMSLNPRQGDSLPFIFSALLGLITIYILHFKAYKKITRFGTYK